MSRIKIFTLFSMMCVSLSSCKTYICPEFDDSLLDKQWIPFYLNDSIYYSSNANDTLMFVVIRYKVEDPVKYQNSKECFYPSSYSTNEINGISISESSNSLSVSFGNDKEYYNPWWTGIVENDNRSHSESNKEFNGVIYSFVFEVEDLSGNRRIDRFVKAGYHGIIEFHDKDTGLTWTQVTNTSR